MFYDLKFESSDEKGINMVSAGGFRSQIRYDALFGFLRSLQNPEVLENLLDAEGKTLVDVVAADQLALSVERMAYLWT